MNRTNIENIEEMTVSFQAAHFQKVIETRFSFPLDLVESEKLNTGKTNHLMLNQIEIIKNQISQIDESLKIIRSQIAICDDRIKKCEKIAFKTKVEVARLTKRASVHIYDNVPDENNIFLRLFLRFRKFFKINQ